ncbi:MAG: MBL fold metallo-hydrolase, partial [Corynebacterium variabile]
MTDNRSRARKVTRKAAPPSAETAASAASTPAFNDGGVADAAQSGQASAPATESGESTDSRKNESGNEGRNSQGGNRNRSRRSRGNRSERNDNSRNDNKGGNRNRGGQNRNDNRGGNRGGGDRRRNAVQTMQGADLTQRLPKPPKAPKDGLRLVALGGISEIGRNMTVFEYHDRLLIIDCGVLFPSSGEPGVDLILPDFSYLEDKWDKVEALVVTHGHEDHIGAIPWLLKQRSDIP